LLADVTFAAQPLLSRLERIRRREVCVTNEILSEYEEKLIEKVGQEIASNVITAILDLPNTKMVQVFYHLRLITSDPDDDKFVDCAFKANARFIVTQDHHYDVLKQTPFPYIDVIGIDEFIRVLQKQDADSLNSR
jgi:putative PIN family toxin of toxin-antitoxin system